VLILRAPGTNCDQETAYAFLRAGGRPDVVHVNRLIDAARGTSSGGGELARLVDTYQILCIPGGFSYGDDLGAGRILASQIRLRLTDAMRKFKDDGKLILGICNGFQALVQSGLLLDEDPQRGPPATLTWNESGKFEDRWVRLTVCGDRSVFLAGIASMYLPVAHAEGRFVTRDDDALAMLDWGGRLVLRYAGPAATGAAGGAAGGAVGGAVGRGAGQVAYPENPNGSLLNVAGVCDATGRVLGLMPHPERHIDPTHHPRWTRGEAGSQGDGLALFHNAVAYFKV
jgi:phosphoribosylformylglycinamidine synthase